MSFERDNEDQTEVTQRRKAMLHRNLMMVGILAMAGLQLSACKHVAAAKTEPEHHAQVKRVEGTEFSSVTLTEKAMQRLGLKTDQVRAEKVTQKNQQVGERRVVPYSALIYDSHGQTWIYTSPSARTFVRHKVEIDQIQGDVAGLKDGSPARTVGAAGRA